jgi:hypothetical protein
MKRPEIMRMKQADLPDDFAKMDKLHDLVDDQGHVSIKIQRACTDSRRRGSLHKNSSKSA